MELVVRKTDLLRELQLFQGIVERKNTIPILANVLIEANGDEVQLLATDLEVGLRSRCAGDGRQERIADAAGEEALRDRQGAARNRRPHRGRQERRQGRGRSLRLAHADAAARGFPDAARGDRHGAARRCRATSLREMVAKTQFAITGEDTRYFLNGALFVLRPDSMSLVSTDGHRLALVTVPRDGAGEAKARTKKCGSSCRGRRCSSSAGCSPKATATSTTSAARTTCSSGRRPAADLADDRRAVPGLRARHPEEQRQARSSSIAIG